MKFRQVIVFIVTIVSIFGIYWINTGKTSLKRTADVAGREEIINYTLPPDFSFSIWGVIYLGFVFYAVYGLKKNNQLQSLLDRTAYPVAISIALNLVWTILVGFELWFTAFILQWIMLLFSVIILLRWLLPKETFKMHKWLSVPFAFYAGWLTVAMIPFTSDLLNKSGWDYAPFSPKTWAIILYVTACFIIFFVYRKLKNPFYIFPLAWALFGFFIRFDGELRIVAGILMLFALGFFIFQLPHFFKSRQAVFISL